jgi:glutamate 5-kinase
MAEIKRWVVKAGSKMVCEGGQRLMRSWMKQISMLGTQHQIEVIWVTSGAIAWAAHHTRFSESQKTLPQKQALSATGQPMIMAEYQKALKSQGLVGSQVLLTADDIRSPNRRKNLQNTLNQLLLWKTIPILNENDAVATEEIQFGDNDSLASQVAIMMKAEKLILMTDVLGLFDADPNKNPSAQLIPYCSRLGPREFRLADRKSVSKQGTGGMYSKLLAADKASKAGITTHLVRGDLPKNLLRIANGLPLGTQVGGANATAL